MWFRPLSDDAECAHRIVDYSHRAFKRFAELELCDDDKDEKRFWAQNESNRYIGVFVFMVLLFVAGYHFVFKHQYTEWRNNSGTTNAMAKKMKKRPVLGGTNGPKLSRDKPGQITRHDLYPFLWSSSGFVTIARWARKYLAWSGNQTLACERKSVKACWNQTDSNRGLFGLQRKTRLFHIITVEGWIRKELC